MTATDKARDLARKWEAEERLAINCQERCKTIGSNSGVAHYIGRKEALGDALADLRAAFNLEEVE